MFLRNEPMLVDAQTIADVVMTRCDELALDTEEEGVLTRRFLTPAMRAAHERVRGWMNDARLEARLDNAGNLVGRRAASTATEKPRVLISGSHLDTVPHAGRYDGALGVLMSIALVERLGEAELPFHLDVAALSEEEGVRFSLPYLGSSALAGKFNPDWLRRRDEHGTTLQEAIRWYGLDPQGMNDAAYDPDEVIGYFEPHLEQGPVLEKCGCPVAAVTGIAGQSRLRLAFHGEAAHAGTTPMSQRRDALCCAAEFISLVRKTGAETEGLRATVGKIKTTPNTANVVPSRVDVTLDIRHIDDPVRERAVAHLLESGKQIAEQGGCAFSVYDQHGETAVKTDTGMTEMLCGAIEHCGCSKHLAPSGAGHDAVAMSASFPVVMLFLRHPGAVSHHPDERVERDDVATGIEVMHQFIMELAERERGT